MRKTKYYCVKFLRRTGQHTVHFLTANTNHSRTHKKSLERTEVRGYGGTRIVLLYHVLSLFSYPRTSVPPHLRRFPHIRGTQRKSPESFLTQGFSKKRWRPPTLPHCIAVPSAQAGLTSLFGMGRGGTPPQ